jgi:hypothetical protein
MIVYFDSRKTKLINNYAYTGDYDDYDVDDSNSIDRNKYYNRNQLLNQRASRENL